MKAFRSVLIILLLIGLSPIAYSQQDNPNQQELPKTKIEKFLAKDGSVIIKSFKEVGYIIGMYLELMTVEVVELIEPTLRMSQYGVKISIKETGRIEKEHSSYIDADELDSLIKGIDYIKTIDSNKTQSELVNENETPPATI